MPKKEKKDILKNFPANTELITYLDENGKQQLKLTFLNDSKVNGELYAYLMSKSIGEEKQTRVYKNILPSMAKIATEVLHYKSRQSGYNSFNYLLENGYLKDMGEYYVIKKENPYFSIPQDLLDYLIDTATESVIKVYIYLGIKNSYKRSTTGEGYVFTIKELCEHLGIDYNYKKNRDKISNCLTCLTKQGLIKTASFREGKVPKMRLIEFSTKKPIV